MLGRCRIVRRAVKFNSELPYLQRRSVDSFGSEEEFQDAVDIATLRKSKPELYHFEQVVPFGSRVYPNDKFKFLENPVRWKGHAQYYKAALEERRREAEKFHPDDWNFDHDHRMTWWGMVKMDADGSGSLAKWTIGDKAAEKTINIGFALPKRVTLKPSRPSREELFARKRALMKAEFEIDERAVHQQFMKHTNGTSLTGVIGAIDRAQGHYNIQRDQYGEGRFFSVVPFGVNWATDQSAQCFWGNELKPAEMQKAPRFDIPSSDNVWTVVVTSLDSNLSSDDELLHYAISNISSSNAEGDEWCPYLPPIPAKGSGYHRLVVTLFHQKEAISTDELKVAEKNSLAQRSFSSADFLNRLQHNLTPAAFRFSQVQWDSSVTSTFHETLQMPQPAFSFDFEEEFPLERPEGIPAGVDFDVVKSWYPTEHKYPRRLGYRTKKPKLKQINYLYDANEHFGALDNQ